VNTTTTMNNAYSGDNIRSAVSLDGQQFWTSGNIASSGQNGTGGVRYATLGGTSSVQIDGSASPGLTTSNINRVDIQNGQLYASSRNNSNNGVWAIGTGTPTSAVNGSRLFDYNALVTAATTRTPGTSSATANFQGPYDFFFSNENTIYVADSILGISKFTRNQAGTWGYSYTFAQTGGVQNDGTNGNAKRAGGTTGMAGRVLSNGSVMLFGTGGFSFGSSTFSGKTNKKEFSFELGGISKTDDGITPVLAWSFDTSRIKTPLFAFLKENGWTEKKGLFG
jgi:hypothetical protein